MSDLIDRLAAISLPVKPKEDRYFQTQNLDDAYEYGWRDLQGCIEKMPPAQPDLSSYSDKLWRNAYERGRAEAQAEIVKCKDCKWYELPSHKITENCVRWMKSNGILLPIKPNDYCSYAERRTDGDGRD